MEKFYNIERIESKLFGVAYASNERDFDELNEGLIPENWQTPYFNLAEGGFADFQANDLDWILCSKKLQKIIKQNASAVDKLVWLDSKITLDGETRNYSILHFPFRPDVLSKEKSLILENGFVVKPTLERKKVCGHNVFSYPSGEFSLIVSEKVKRAIESENCTGIEFLEISTYD
jgi:hypothetical protein